MKSKALWTLTLAAAQLCACATRLRPTELARSLATDASNIFGDGCLPSFDKIVTGPAASSPRWNPYSKLLSGLAPDTRADWLKRFVNDFARAVRVKIAWSKYMNEEFKSKYPRVIWIQATGLKEMNESFWKIGGTEHYLSLLDEQIEKTLVAHPEWGELIHFTYKDRAIATALTEKQVNEQLMPEIRSRVARALAKFFEQDYPAPVKPSPEIVEANWARFIGQYLTLGVGFDHVSAYLDVRGLSSIAAYRRWAGTTTALRQELAAELELLKISFNDLFTAKRYFSESPKGFRDWCIAHKLDDKMIADFENYWSRLQVGDFLPLDSTLPPEQINELTAFMRAFETSGTEPQAFETVYRKVRNSWSVERTSFFSDTLNARYLIAVDIRGLGVTSAQSRDQWISNGAHLKDLPRVYIKVSKYLDQRFETLEKELGDIVGEQVRLYRSGDDGLIAVPDVSPETLDKIKIYFDAKKTDLYFHIERVNEVGDSEDIARAIAQVRDELFSLKPSKPKD